MSIEAAEMETSGGTPSADALGPDGAEDSRRSRALGRQAVLDTLARPGARLGLAWLGVLAFCAVFGPFLASSHPLLMKIDGHWSSPVMRYLYPSDVLLLLATAVVIVLSMGRWF